MHNIKLFPCLSATLVFTHRQMSCMSVETDQVSSVTWIIQLSGTSTFLPSLFWKSTGRGGYWWEAEKSGLWRACQMHFSLVPWESQTGCRRAAGISLAQSARQRSLPVLPSTDRTPSRTARNPSHLVEVLERKTDILGLTCKLLRHCKLYKWWIKVSTCTFFFKQNLKILHKHQAT